ncbi:hypothetical protein [Azotosporobacter soli]|uniref:hypothetical protein n=1 Tax=Azotosporobacter soli TaxID=3055040 RepID=UPI0031FE767D
MATRTESGTSYWWNPWQAHSVLLANGETVFTLPVCIGNPNRPGATRHLVIKPASQDWIVSPDMPQDNGYITVAETAGIQPYSASAAAGWQPIIDKALELNASLPDMPLLAGQLVPLPYVKTHAPLGASHPGYALRDKHGDNFNIYIFTNYEERQINQADSDLALSNDIIVRGRYWAASAKDNAAVIQETSLFPNNTSIGQFNLSRDMISLLPRWQSYRQPDLLVIRQGGTLNAELRFFCIADGQLKPVLLRLPDNSVSDYKAVNPFAAADHSVSGYIQVQPDGQLLLRSYDRSQAKPLDYSLLTFQPEQLALVVSKSWNE